MRNYFGSAVPADKKTLRPDIMLMGYRGLGRHHFVDVAITDPATVARTQAPGRAADVPGWAAEERAKVTKKTKYTTPCARIDSTFVCLTTNDTAYCTGGRPPCVCVCVCVLLRNNTGYCAGGTHRQNSTSIGAGHAALGMRGPWATLSPSRLARLRAGRRRAPHALASARRSGVGRLAPALPTLFSTPGALCVCV